MTPIKMLEADLLEQQKLQGWEFFLLALLLEERLRDARVSYDNLAADRWHWPRHSVSVSEWGRWWMARGEEIQTLNKKLVDLFRESFAPAVGVGRPGNTAAIRQFVKDIADVCDKLYLWERAVMEVEPVPGATELHARLYGMTEPWFRQIAALPEKLREFIAKDCGVPRPFKLSLDFDTTALKGWKLPPAYSARASSNPLVILLAVFGLAEVWHWLSGGNKN